jgi:uncharacterized protein
MKCPICIEPELLMSERQGIEIDYCPKCRGVWLDRGELDKLIDRAEPAPRSTGPSQADRHSEQRSDYRSHQKRKRGGFLGDIFDFD